METTPPGTPRRDNAQHDEPPQDRPGAETPPQYRGWRERLSPFSPLRSRSSSEESGLGVVVLPGPVDEGDVGGGDGGGDGGGGDGVDGGGNERAGRGKTVGVALFFLVNAVSLLAAWQHYTRPSHEVLELKDDGIEDFGLGKFDVLENDATDHLWPLKPEWVGVGVGTSTDIIVGSITGLDELAGGSELTQQCDRCKKGDIKRPRGLDSKSYNMPDSGVAKMLLEGTPAEVRRGSILSKYLAALAKGFNTLQENCHVTNPFSPMMKYIKRDQTKMDSVDYAVLYHCYESKSMSAKGGRVTKSRAASNDRYAGEDCVNVMVLDRMLETDLAPLKDVYEKFPKRHSSMKPGKYKTITIKEALKKQKKTGMSFLYTDVFLPMITGCTDCPWRGGHNLRGLQKGHHLNSGESGMQEALGIRGGAVHEMLRAGGNMQWSADHGLDEINADIHNLLVPRLRQFQRGFTGDERSPNSFEESTFDPATSGQSWATTFASGDSIFSQAMASVATVDELDIVDDEPEQQSYDVEEEEEGDSAPTSIHTKLYEATVLLTDYVLGVADSVHQRLPNGWPFWVDTFEKKADVTNPEDDLSAADRGTSLSNVRKLLNAFTKTVGDPFKTFRIMNLNENKLSFEGKDYDMATLLTEEYGYKLLHTYRYVRVYWLENDDCQISLIFLHKPWHIAFQSYPLFGKGSRGPYSRQELAIMANMALTIEWQRTVWQGLVNGNIQRAEATQTAFGSVPSAFGLFVYCYRDAHLDSQVCAALPRRPSWCPAECILCFARP